ncbi:MAG TPA: hypothetical protein VEA80_04870 [Vitreimonas sp.]|uniref:hypothetical protein n=1 Tax=Vitreimonas sp. TaxID=3069702 RepID=UPI002D6F3D83|nr:hypothetical protein [Vitreimonas sp.]HYD86784.1 hypothetical protein [Vitreimonas sp.]
MSARDLARRMDALEKLSGARDPFAHLSDAELEAFTAACRAQWAGEADTAAALLEAQTETTRLRFARTLQLLTTEAA